MTMQKTRKFSMLEPLSLLFALILIAAVCTYVLPAGQFDRVENAETGRMVVVPNTFHEIEPSPVTPFGVFTSFPKGMEEAGYIMFFLLIIGGAFNVLEATGAVNVAMGSAIKRMAGRESLMIPVLMFIFSLGGCFIGMAEEMLAFLPMVLAVCLTMGFDSITAVAICLLGAGAGFAGTMTNPFTIGVAQGIAGLPLFSGIEYRAIIYVVLVTVGILYVWRYASKIKKDPTKSPMYEADKNLDFRIDMDNIPDMTIRHKLVLAAFALAIIAVVFGVIKLGFYIEELGAIFIILTVVAGILGGLYPDEIAQEFTKGASNFVGAALIVGFARVIVVILDAGNVMDTIINGLSYLVKILPPSLAAAGMFIVQTIISFVVSSGSGQAALTMPIMAPLADVVGVTRQTAVLCFQFADAFSNNMTVTSTEIMAAIAMAKIPWTTWAKWFLPLFSLWSAIALVFIMISVAIGYGPF